MYVFGRDRPAQGQQNFPLAPVQPQSSICLPRHARCVRVATPELAAKDQGRLGTASNR